MRLICAILSVFVILCLKSYLILTGDFCLMFDLSLLALTKKRCILNQFLPTIGQTYRAEIFLQ